MATTFEAASQSFGTPRPGAGLLATAQRAWRAFVRGLSAVDYTRDAMTPAELMRLAEQYEATSPSLASDLRAAALLAQRSHDD